jgi:hypothetical protein
MSAIDKAARVGAAIGDVLEAIGVGRIIRAALGKVYGHCRFCDKPLTGHSPDRSCEVCYVHHVLGPAVAKGLADGFASGEEPDA